MRDGKTQPGRQSPTEYSVFSRYVNHNLPSDAHLRYRPRKNFDHFCTIFSDFKISTKWATERFTGLENPKIRKIGP